MLSGGLVPAFKGRLPSVLPPMGATRIAVQLTDTGAAKFAGPATVRLFASTDQSLDGSDVLLGTAQRNIQLRPRGSTTVPLTFSSPTTLPDGDYFLLAEVDGSTNVAAPAKPIGFGNPYSDVAVQFSRLPSRPVEIDGPRAGQSSATVNIVNTGNVPAHGTVSLSFYLSADGVLDGTDPLLAMVSNKSISLKPRGHQAISFRVAIPPGTAVGAYFLFAVVTPGSAVHDANPGNNTAVSSARVSVVNRLPQPTIIDRRTDCYEITNYVAPVDEVYYVDTGAGDDSSDSGSDQSDYSQPSSAPADSPSSMPSDSSSDGSPSSDDSSSSDDSDSTDPYNTGGDN